MKRRRGGQKVAEEAVSELESGWVWARFLRNIEPWHWHLSRHGEKRGVRTRGGAEHCIWHLTSWKRAAILSQLEEREREREGLCEVVKCFCGAALSASHSPLLLCLFRTPHLAVNPVDHTKTHTHAVCSSRAARWQWQHPGKIWGGERLDDRLALFEKEKKWWEELSGARGGRSDKDRSERLI